MMNNEEIRQKLSPLIRRAWSDDQLRQRLLNDPEAVVREYGIEIPAGTKPRFVVEKNSVSFEFVPQTAADSVELAESALGAVVGGRTNTKGSSTSTFPTETVSLNYGKIEWVYTQQH